MSNKNNNNFGLGSTVNKSTESSKKMDDDNNNNNNNNNNNDDDDNSVMIGLNRIVAETKMSATVEIFGRVKEMESEGQSITSLCVGEPDFDPPKSVLDAAIAAIMDGNTRYTSVIGTASLRSAIANDLLRRKNVKYDPSSEIVVANGAKQCVYQGILATCGPGDKVIVPSPYWPSYPEIVRLVGAQPIILPTLEQDGYLLSPQALRQCLNQHGTNVKCLILCNPSNPTGGVHGPTLLTDIASVLMDYPWVSVLADEIYERLVYGPEQHISFASLPGMFSRTMTINGFSKAYAMTGLRLGYVAAPRPLAKACTTIQSQLTSCAGSISQAAGLVALTEVSDEELDHNVVIMKERRDYVLSQLRSMPNVQLNVDPCGAFYVLPDISAYCNNDDHDGGGGGGDVKFCLDLLEEKKLAIVPGSGFGAPGTVRISYATSMEELIVAMQKLREFLMEHEKK